VIIKLSKIINILNEETPDELEAPDATTDLEDNN